MSIDCRELRIGNWVMVDKVEEEGYPSTITQVSGIDVDGGVWVEWYIGSGDSLLCLPNQVLPIPLNEEVLLASGFLKYNYGWTIGKSNPDDDECFGLFDQNYGNRDLKLKLNGAYLPMPVVKYLHQLQNIYFALTGTELIYSP